MFIGIKNDFYCNIASRKIRLICTGCESSKFFREKGSKQYLSMDSLPFQYSSNSSFLVQVLMENMVGNLFPRGIPIPLTYTHVCVYTHTHTRTHICTPLDYSFVHRYLVSATLCQTLYWRWATRQNMPLWIIQSSPVQYS